MQITKISVDSMLSMKSSASGSLLKGVICSIIISMDGFAILPCVD